MGTRPMSISGPAEEYVLYFLLSGDMYLKGREKATII